MPADRLPRRLLLFAGVLSVALIAVFVNYLLHGGADELNPVAEAAERTAAMPGARLKMEMTYKSDESSKTVVTSGTGVFNARTGRSRGYFGVAVPGRAPVSMMAVGDQRVSYVRSSTLASKLPPGKEWMGVEPLLGHSPEEAFGTGTGAEGELEMLKATGGGVEDLGHQVVRGHRTTLYKGSVDLSNAVDLLTERGEAALAKEYEAVAEKTSGPPAVEVWVDEHGLAREIDVVQKIQPAPDAPTITAETRIEFFDFGIRPKIELPPKDRVYDYTPVMREKLGLNGQ